MRGPLAAILAAFAAAAFAADYPEDATLRAVHFIDENEGWAVGDQGAIFHTMNRGVNWDRQPSATAATLTGVRMLNTHEGLVVGAQTRMHDAGTNGVVLATGNGGHPWLPVTMGGTMPGLRGLALGSRDGAWAWGDGSDQNPGGLFATADFGKTWNPLRTARRTDWRCGALFDGANGFVGGTDRALAAIRGGAVKPLETAWRPGTALRAMARAGGRVWAVGDRAQAMRSDDAGVTWTAVADLVPAAVRNVVDFHAVAARGEQVWIAGLPGAVVHHSADAGKTWERQATGVATPLYALDFPTERHGCAVGAYGVRLRTEDAGKTWEYAGPHAAPPRAAALFVAADSRSLPLAVMARYGLDQGYHCAALTVCSADLAGEPIAAANRGERFAEGARLAGAAAAEALGLFPLAPDRAGEPVAAALAEWNRRLDGKAYAELVRALAVALRMHRPNVVVTHAATAAGPQDEPAGMVARAVYEAIGVARSADRLPELRDALGLAPHVVNKVYAFGRGNGQQPVVENAGGDVAERLGQNYANAAADGEAAACAERVPRGEAAVFALVASGKPDAEDGKSLFAGLDLKPGSEARRVLRGTATLSEAERKQLQTRQNLQALAEQGGAAITAEQSLASLQMVARGMRPAEAARTLHRFARRYADQGRWDLAQDGFEFLVASFPEQPAAVDGCHWLLAYGASGEARVRRGTAPEGDAAKWRRRAAAAADLLRRTCPEQWAEAGPRLVMAAAARGLREPAQQKIHLDAVAALDPRAGWRDVAAQELALLEGGSGPTALRCPLVRTRPKLDGQFDDDIWKGEGPSALVPPVGAPAGYGAEVRFRHDAQYLYVAVRCPYPDAACRKEKIARDANTRDAAELAATDRVELAIDIDRDYATWWRFAVDQQGRVADDCWGDASWNPRWHVATAADDKEWRLEAAIPLAEILPPDHPADQPLAVGIQRIVPGRGVFALRQPAGGALRPQTFQLLRLENRGEVMLGH